MAFCTKCGSKTPETGQFCGKCGAARVSQDAPDAPATPVKKRLSRNQKIIGSLILGLFVFALLISLTPDDSQQQKPASQTSVAAPVPQAASDDGVREYAAKVQAMTGNVSKSLGDFSALMSAPRLYDVSWKMKLVLDLAMWQAAYSDAQKLTPPAKLAGVNQQLLAALSNLNDAASNVARGIDQHDADELELAGSEIREAGAIATDCTRQIRAAR
jgi:hypothetical protein